MSVKEQSDLVSVIIPAYNHQNYIQECIVSIAKQTYPDIELLVLDDGSSDQTYEKAKQALMKYPDRFKRVWIEKQENTGKTEALNRLIEQVNGEYVYLIDSDDVAKPLAVEMNWNFLKDNPSYVLSVGNNEFIDSNSVPILCSENMLITNDKNQDVCKTFTDCSGVDHMGGDFGKYETFFFKGNYIPNGYLIRASMFKKIPKFTKEAPLEDYYLMLQLSKYGGFKYIDEILYSRRLHATNVSGNMEHMKDMANKTHEYEMDLIRKGNFSDDCLPEFLLFVAFLHQRYL